MDFNKCNTCTNQRCRVNENINSANSKRQKSLIEDSICPGYVSAKFNWKLGILTLAHPTSLNTALSQFPWAKAILSINLR